MVVPNSNGLDWVTTNVDNFYPEQPDFVRGRVMRGLWRFLEQPNGDLAITLIFQMDMGGQIPAWVIDLATLDLPKTMIHNVADFLKKPFGEVTH